MSKKFLTIELDDINSVPKVVYQGEELVAKVRVSFDWETNGVGVQPSYIKIKQFDENGKWVDTKTIQYNEPSY